MFQASASQPSPSGYTTATTQPPAQKKRRVWLIVLIVVVVVVVVVAILAYVAVQSTSVDVTAINITSSDNVCGVNGHTLAGFTTGPSGTIQDTLVITGGLILSCTVNTVSATTSGFSISGANTPLTVPADGTESLSFTIHAPSGAFDGVLTIDLE
jgi:hypothetical protein